MFVLTFTPGMERDQFVSSLPMQSLAPKIDVDKPTLADCEKAFNDACDFARKSLTRGDVMAHFRDERTLPREMPIVVVCGFWRDGPGRRKPAGFNKRRWLAYIQKPEAVSAAAE